MTLVPFRTLMEEAEKGTYAVGYFECWNLESLLAADATDAITMSWLAHLRAGSGARAEANDLMARATALHGCRYVPAFHLALGYVGLEDHDRAEPLVLHPRLELAQLPLQLAKGLLVLLPLHYCHPPPSARYSSDRARNSAPRVCASSNC